MEEMTNIYWDADRDQWKVVICWRGSPIQIGRYETVGEAKAARDRAKRIYNGSSRIPPRPTNKFDTVSKI